MEFDPVNCFTAFRRGDIQAAIDLIRLDRTVLFDPKIAALMHKNGHSTDPGIQEQLSEASTKTPYPPVKLWTQQARNAGLLLHIANLIRYPLKPKAVRRMFDAIAADRKIGNRDETLPKDDAVFKKGLYRARDFWRTALKRDKICLVNVPLN